MIEPQHIAIIGTSMNFPGHINSLEEMHQNLLSKKDSITNVPSERWNAEYYYNEDRFQAAKINNKKGGFIEGVKDFDAQLFGISPAEAMAMDPQLRLSLELAFRLFENAGYSNEHLSGSATGVYMGACFNDYRDLCYSNPATGVNPHTITGNTNCCISGRIAYYFGLEGPSLTLDTACSSSLVAVHYGCKDLLVGDVNMAVAGGINIMIRPENHMAFSSLNALSPDGVCYSFDARANGYVRSEGAGLVLLKRLEDAIAQEDQILGVIRAVKVNNDGRSRSFTAPNPKAQSSLIRKTLKDAGLEAEDIDFIEAHGPGTHVGDPIELSAIANVFDQTKRDRKLYVGSIKSNIGHTESASGIASLLKAVASVKYNIIYPNLNFSVPNPKFDWARSCIEVPIDEISLEGTVRVGVNSFGVSGTNVHLILESSEVVYSDNNEQPLEWPYILPVSASNSSVLSQRKNQLQEWLDGDPNEMVHKLASLSRFRMHLPFREMIWSQDPKELINKLIDLDINVQFEGDYSNAKKVFVFSGQGAMWEGMGQELFQRFTVFRDSMNDSFWTIKNTLGIDIRKEFSKIPTDEVERQLLTFSYQIALADLLKHVGLTPDIVLGHSLGEVVAACFSSCIDKETAIQIVEARASAMNLIAGEGTMWVVGMSKENWTNHFAKDFPTLDLAAENGIRTIVLSGPEDIFIDLASKLNQKDIFNQKTQINYASHSRYVQKVVPHLRNKMKDLSYSSGEPNFSFYSTSQLKYVEAEDMNTEFWIENILRPVRYYEALENISKQMSIIGIEISSHGLLSSVSHEIIDQDESRSIFMPVILKYQPESTSLLQFLRNLYIRNIDLSWDAIYQYHGNKNTSIPPQHMDKKPYWIGQDFEDQELFLSESAEGEVFEGWANYLKRLISSVTLISLQDLDEEQSFRNLGLDSLMILKLRNQIQNERNVKISSTAFWNYPDIKTMSSFLELTFGSSHSANSSENGHVQSDDDVNNELDQFINDLL